MKLEILELCLKYLLLFIYLRWKKMIYFSKIAHTAHTAGRKFINF